jgi:cobalt-zinc-cadmium efflux system outer membrane protein
MTRVEANLVAFSLAWALASSASAAQVSAPPLPSAPWMGALEADPLLAALIQQAWASRPELAQARSRLEAQRERVPQVGALPDPTLTLGLQNDGFRAIEIGRMETSWGILMASQTFPWLGKRGLRSELASLEARAARADLARVELSLRAEVERGYLDLLVVRGQLELLGRLRALWSQAEGVARARYEAGEGAQTDILRAQLESTRLRQRWIGLAAEERRRLAVINRVRGAPLDATLPTPRSAADLPDPPLPEAAEAFTEAEARSPELERARIALRQAERRSELADKEAIPDPTLTLGIMPRGGPFEPMWQATVSLPLPVWASRKQSRALAENRALQRASSEGLEAVRQLLRQRLAERRALIAAARETNELFRRGLLVQSEATVASALAQYQVGRLTFAAVLEALQGYVADQGSFLDSIASAQRLAIAERELSLESVEGPPTGGMSGAAFPGAGGASGSAATSSASPASGEGAGASAMPSRM